MSRRQATTLGWMALAAAATLEADGAAKAGAPRARPATSASVETRPIIVRPSQMPRELGTRRGEGSSQWLATLLAFPTAFKAEGRTVVEQPPSSRRRPQPW